MSSRELSTFELKSGAVDALHLVVKTGEYDALRAELGARYGAIPDFFANDPVAIDLRRLATDADFPLAELAALLHTLRLHPIGAIGHESQRDWVLAGGMAMLADHERERRAAPAGRVVADDDGASASEQPPPAVESVLQAAPTTVIERPLRSGQRVYVEGDLVVLALVSHGAEVIAGGNIHIYAPLRGRALAGVRGDQGARIFCTCMEPELISIAGIYRTVETALPDDVQGKPAQVRLDGEKLIVEPLNLR